jgi:hypothetical protein
MLVVMDRPLPDSTPPCPPATRLRRRLAFALALGAATPLARAASTASISASDSASAAVGSLSNSVRGASNSSAGNRNALLDGEHRIVRVVAADAGTVQLTLRPAADAADSNGEWLLRLPRAVAAPHAFAPGQTIVARQRDYGYEFSAGEPRRAFFLALHDEWLQDLRTRRVGS